MTNVIDNSIQASIIALAMDYLGAQSFVPVSPCAVTPAGDVQLCLAVALAKASLAVRESIEAANAFQERILSSRDAAIGEAAFGEAGWTREEFRRKRELNDSASDEERKRVVLDRLSQEAAALGCDC